MRKNCLVIGLILLYIGTAIVPSIGQRIDHSSVPASRGNWLYVGGSGPGNYSKIQDAIDNASDGDTVFVFDDSSPYYERVNVHKTLRLVGESQQTTVIDGRDPNTPISTTVSLTADGVTFTGFTVRNGGMLLGVDLRINSNHSTIMGNTFIGNISHSPLVFNIILADSHNTIIKENTVSLGAFGIYVYASNETTITGNNITKHFSYGLCLYNSRRNTISMNNIMENGQNAFFVRDVGFLPLSNHWSANYWGKPCFLLKRVAGQMILLEGENFALTLPLVNFDWFPALKPYDIGGST